MAHIAPPSGAMWATPFFKKKGAPRGPSQNFFLGRLIAMHKCHIMSIVQKFKYKAYKKNLEKCSQMAHITPPPPIKYGQVNSYYGLNNSSDFLPWQCLLLWVTVMICEASEGIMPDIMVLCQVLCHLTLCAI